MDDSRIHVPEHDLVPPSNFEMKVHNYRAYRFVYFILGFVEVILALRLFLKMMGANPASFFAKVMYGLSGIFLLPFKGLFPLPAPTDGVIARVFEASVIVAMIVYALLAWGVAKWIVIFKSKPTK
jgi:hypothetical protein